MTVEMEVTKTVKFDKMASSFCGMTGNILESFALYKDGEVVYESDDRKEYERAKEALNK